LQHSCVVVVNTEDVFVFCVVRALFSHFNKIQLDPLITYYIQSFYKFWLRSNHHQEHIYIILTSSYPSVFRLVASFPSGIVARHSFHCCI